MSILDKLRKRSETNYDQLKKSLHEDKDGRGTGPRDPRFWVPQRDKAGNATVKLRFLPPPLDDPKENSNYIRYFSYNFNVNGRWYSEKSLWTLGQEDPCSKRNSQLWDQGDKATVRKRKRIENFVANVLIIEDEVNPENNGKVFMWRFGKQVLEKIKEAMHVIDEDEEEDPDKPAHNMPEFDPFDVLTGATLKLKVFTKKSDDGSRDYPNYERSFWLEPAPLSEDEDYLETILSQVHPLQPFIAPESFKSYEELEKHLRYVESGPSNSASADDRVREAASVNEMPTEEAPEPDEAEAGETDETVVREEPANQSMSDLDKKLDKFLDL